MFTKIVAYTSKAKNFSLLLLCRPAGIVRKQIFQTKKLRLLPKIAHFFYQILEHCLVTKVSGYTMHITIERRTLNGVKSTTFFFRVRQVIMNSSILLYIAMYDDVVCAIVNYVRKKIREKMRLA